MDTSHTTCQCKRMGYISLIVIAAALVLMLLIVVAGAMKIKREVNFEQSQVKTDTTQAVFLSDGQVYFGDITEINKSTLALEHVFYLQENQKLQSGESETLPGDASNFSLVKLGTSELHLPQDTMVINRDEVMFWENLKTESPVVKAITNYKP
ncbi:MAG: hypothetical protein HYV32_00105 [Candidatus Kerfeldbacteria bacterium]|nr:hypothetical protein [Candidatus Kerfeldbacteria bacterium]